MAGGTYQALTMIGELTPRLLIGVDQVTDGTQPTRKFIDVKGVALVLVLDDLTNLLRESSPP